MRSGVIVKKLGMSSLFGEKGEVIPVTLLKFEDCQVVDHKVKDKHGYSAVVVGAQNVKASKLSKSVRTFFEKSKLGPKYVLREFRISDDSYLDVGTVLTPEFFSVGQYVDIAGISIGKGFAGGMKRHNFRGLEASHGVSVSHRSHGSTGGRQDPGRVFKNKKMAGHMGSVRVKVQSLKIVAVDKENGILLVKGAVPGSKGSLVSVTDAIKKAAVI